MHPQAQGLLAAMAEAGGPPLYEMSVADARAVTGMVSELIGPGPAVAKLPANHANPVAAIRGPLLLSGRRDQPTSPHAIRLQPVTRSGTQWRGSPQPK